MASNRVVKCEVPSLSVLDRNMIATAFFSDAYRTNLVRAHASVIDIFAAVFGHHPQWMKSILIVRNRVAAYCGLAVPSDDTIMNPEFRCSYAVGDTIGPWPIYALSASELVAGRDNTHLDFRLSLLKESDGVSTSVVVSTICTTHNLYGKLYLLIIIPFHKWGVQRLLSRAIAAGRL